MQSRRWEDLSWQEVAEASSRGWPVIVPVGAIEQHGPHLPLATDCIIAEAIALEASAGFASLVAPTVRFGARSRALSGGGEGFPGTLSLRANTLVETLSTIIAGIARSGFSRVCVMNWHYENAGHLWEACDLAIEKDGRLTILLLESALPKLSPEELTAVFPNGFPGWDVEHASVAETSLVQLLRPELVHAELIRDDQAQRHPDWDVLPAPPEFIPSSGVLWHATEGSVEKGRILLSASVRYVQTALVTEFGAR